MIVLCVALLTFCISLCLLSSAQCTDADCTVSERCLITATGQKACLTTMVLAKTGGADGSQRNATAIVCLVVSQPLC